MMLLPLIAWAVVATPTPIQSPDFKDAWTKIQTSISQRFYARETRKAEMERLFAKYGPIASGAKSKEDFDKSVNAMIAEFGDSHFALLTDEDQGYYMMDNLANPNGAAEMPQIGIWARPKGSGYEAMMVVEGSEAWAAGVRKGDELKSIDGQPYQPILSLKSKVGSKVKLEFVKAGQTKTVECEVKSGKGLQFFLQGTRDSAQVFEQDGKKIGYIHLWTQANDDFRNTLKAAVMGRLRNTDAFILDLRDGFGGRPENFFEPFFMPDVKVDYKVGSVLQQTSLGYGSDKPMVVLINEGSRSAKEVSSFMFKKSHRAVLIGSTTAGHVLGTFPSRVNDWAYLEIPMAEVTADGQTLEKVGVSPDIRVSPEYDASGKDLVVQAALAQIKKDLQNKK